MSFTVVGTEADADDVRRLLPSTTTVSGTRIEFATDTSTEHVHAITGWALERGVELGGLTVARPSLEDVFLGLAGEDDAV